MFCAECGQPIAMNPATRKWEHQTAKTYPELDDHEAKPPIS